VILKKQRKKILSNIVARSRLPYFINMLRDLAKAGRLLHLTFVICNLSFVFFAGSSFAATWLDPSFKWKTLETPHFSIHFYEGEEQTARRLAPIAEEIHNKLVPIIKHQPDIKTSVVLLDTVDFGNGFTTVIPDPRITLYLTDWSTNVNPYKHDLWLKFVFLHEYVHVLHLDIADGTASLFRLIFGRVIFPNAIEPVFLTEGIATYMETALTRAGRGRDPRWDMMMRMDVLENNVKSIDQASVDTVRWPQGALRYLYGVKFLEYISNKYGEDKIISLSHIYGDFLFSYGIDGAFLFLYRKSLKLLWDEWLVDLQNKYARQKQSLGNLTFPVLLTRTGYNNLKPKWSKDSRTIYYQQSNADVYPNIRAIDYRTRKDYKVLEGLVFDNNLSFDPSGSKLLFTKLGTYRNYYSYKDLYLYNLKTKKLSRLTAGARIDDADLSPDGAKIVFVHNKLGTRTLRAMDFGGKNSRLLGNYEENVQYYSPRWSPDGKQIAVAKHLLSGAQKIFLVDPVAGTEKQLIFEKGLVSEANPCFSPDGQYVYFDSDRTGIVNLYAYHLESGRLYQLTNVIGGAMMPDVSPDGQKIAYVSYSSRGYDIAVMGVSPGTWLEVSTPITVAKPILPINEKRSTIRTSGFATEYTNVHDYNPIPTLRPKFWLPLEYTNENGSQLYVSTSGSDVLGEHNYLVQIGYDFIAERPQYNVSYANNQFLPQITLALNDVAVPYDWEDTTLWMRDSSQSAALSFYDNRVFYEWDRQVFSLGYEQTNISNIGSLEIYSVQPDLGNIKGVFAQWSYLSSRQYAKSISPEDGIDLSLRVSLNSSDLGSDYSFTNYSAALSTYFAAPGKHHVIAPTLYGFYSKGDQLTQSNYSWRYLPLRGYPSTNLAGNKGVLLSTEYRFPLVYPEVGFMYGYLFFDRIWADLFFDVGGATFAPVSELTFKRSAGLELNLDILSFQYAAVTLKLGYVKGFDENGEDLIYFTIGVY
jgi:Tol biopolymer transport system component